MKPSVLFGPLLAMVSSVAVAEPASPCEGIAASVIAYRLADLPPEIRDDLNAMSQNAIADAGVPIRRTDAPTDAEKDLALNGLVHGLLVGQEWFVSVDTGTGGIRTFGYVRDSDGRYFRLPSHYFGGPACEAIAAALSGVTSPGGFGF